MIKLFDTHAHLGDEQFDADREEIIASMKGAGVKNITEIGASVNSSKEAVEIANAHDFIYCTVGIHPEYAHTTTEDDYLTIYDLAKKNCKVRAIGEIGIDYHYDDSASREEQISCFERQIDIAKELKLPIVVHDRESKGDTLKVLKDKGVSNGVVHCFSGSAETAKIILDMGMMISFTGVITFKNARRALEALKIIPLDRLMIETDCPYMAPEPHRGVRNDSRYVRYVAEKMAEVKGVDLEELCDITYNNAVKFYGIKENLI